MNLRTLIAARRKALRLTRAALAQRLAPRWCLPPDSAETALYRFERGRGELTAERLADVLTELRLCVVPEEPARE